VGLTSRLAFHALSSAVRFKAESRTNSTEMTCIRNTLKHRNGDTKTWQEIDQLIKY